VRHFAAALPAVGDDARVQQNLAVVRGWQGDADRAAAHWKRYLDQFASQVTPPPGQADYKKRLARLVRERLKKLESETAEAEG
jgi:Tfp pilus assembly protein PilF